MKLSISLVTFIGVSSAFAEERVNLQWSICETSANSVAQRLEVPNNPRIAAVTYFETNPPIYLDKGAHFKIKEIGQQKSIQSSVKMRFSQRMDIAENCEWDRYGNQLSYTCEVEEKTARRAAPWSQRQKAFVENYVPVNWAELKEYGPYQVQFWEYYFRNTKLTLDSVNPPAPLLPVIEISVKVPASQSNQVFMDFSDYFASKNIQLCLLQESKLRRLFRQLGF